MATLPTNFKDDILDTSVNTRRRYRVHENTDGTIELEDVTEYSQVGDVFGAGQINSTNTEVNKKFDKNMLVRDLDTINAITKEGYAPDALAFKELNDSLIGYPDMTNKIYSTTWLKSFSWTAPEDCWIYGVVSTNKYNGSSIIKLNGATVVIVYDDDSTHTTQMGVLFPCKKGDVISKATNGDTQALINAYGMRK